MVIHSAEAWLNTSCSNTVVLNFVFFLPYANSLYKVFPQSAQFLVNAFFCQRMK